MPGLIGQTLGQYQITREIARGGMAVVYEANQSILDRRVAIKVLPPELSLDETFVQRFTQEARAAARLSHPNIVTIYDVGRYESYYYIVMQLLDGEALSDLIRRVGRLSPERVLQILAQIASALDYAHGQGLVHRDIKPANIIVGAGDHATLTDFGIAKAAENTRLTRTGMLVGTPEYMSPEQASGQPVGPASDLYSLGIVIYQMLAGRAPFQGDTTPALLHKQVYEQPQPVRTHAPDLPKGVDAVLAKALAKDPSQRFSSAVELTRALGDAFGSNLAERSRAARPDQGYPLPDQPVSPLHYSPQAIAGGPSGAGSPSRGFPTPATRRPQRRGPRTLWIAGAIGALGILLFAVMLGLLLSDKGGTPPVVLTAAPTARPASTGGAALPARAPTAASPGAKLLRLNFGPGDVPTIDPALANDASSIQIAEETTVGLSRQDETTSQAEPGMAESWDVSPDGKVYTFHLRGDVPWVRHDGAQVVKVQDCTGLDRVVTAHDFEYGILRALNPKTESARAFVLAQAIQGAGPFKEGVAADPATVGVKALDDRTLQVTFVEPAAYNALIIGMWMAHAQPKWVIEGDDCTEARGDRWIEPGFFQSYGPYALHRWVHESSISLVKNPFWPGSDAIPRPKIEEIVWSMLDEEAALARYEAGEMESTTVPSADLDRVRADPRLSAEFTVAPTACTYYYGFNTKAPYVQDPRVRRALSMAIDRRALSENVTGGGEESARWFARPGLAGAPTLADHPTLGVTFDPAKANAELDSFLAEKGLTREKLDLTISHIDASSHQKIAEAIRAMWKEQLGLDVKLASQEWEPFVAAIRDPKSTPQIFGLGWCMDYADANNFDRDFAARGGSGNPEAGGGLNWQNRQYEKLVVQAARELDPRERADLYAQAEEILVQGDAVMAPIHWYTHLTVTKPYVRRSHAVVEGLEHVEKWLVTD
jgi:oligopeptide transport system substrate-binding protein